MSWPVEDGDVFRPSTSLLVSHRGLGTVDGHTGEREMREAVSGKEDANQMLSQLRAALL